MYVKVLFQPIYKSPYPSMTNDALSLSFFLASFSDNFSKQEIIFLPSLPLFPKNVAITYER